MKSVANTKFVRAVGMARTRHLLPLAGLLLCLVSHPWFSARYVLAQQPQTSSATNGANSSYLQGVGTGYWPTAGSGLTLNVAAGTAFCNDARVTYAGGTLTMTASAANYVYLNPSGTCAPTFNATGLPFNVQTIATVPNML